MILINRVIYFHPKSIFHKVYYLYKFKQGKSWRAVFWKHEAQNGIELKNIHVQSFNKSCKKKNLNSIHDKAQFIISLCGFQFVRKCFSSFIINLFISKHYSSCDSVRDQNQIHVYKRTLEENIIKSSTCVLKLLSPKPKRKEENTATYWL